MSESFVTLTGRDGSEFLGNKLLETSCSSKDFKYSCPKCNLRYCSLDCYRSKKHQNCSEAFYKESLDDAVKYNSKKETYLSSGYLEKHKMRSLVEANDYKEKYEESEEYDEEEDDDDLIERFESVNFDEVTEDELWKRLTPKERQKFVHMLATQEGVSELAQEMAYWKPWWLKFKEKLAGSIFIQDLDIFTQKPDQKKEVLAKDLPALLETTAFKALTNYSMPDDRLLYSIIEAVFAYVFLCRKYNGNKDWPLEAFTNLLEYACCLKPHSKTLWNNTNHLVDNIIGRYLSINSKTSDRIHFLTVLCDLCSIVSFGWHCICLCLSDLHEILKNASEMNKIKRQLVMKKVYFYVSYCKFTAGDFDKKDRLGVIFDKLNVYKQKIEDDYKYFEGLGKKDDGDIKYKQDIFLD